ncbi:MAG: CHAD domain-containing protein [Pirellulaceae bacterium]
MPKWMTNAKPNAPVGRVAAACVKTRLKRVRKHLPKAASQADRDIEHIHQLRVWTRRAAAALRLFKPLLPKRRAKWMRSQLKSIRRAAGDARDLDVLLQRLEQWSDPPGDLAPLIYEVQQRRSAAQPAVVEVYDQMRQDDLLKHRCRELVARVRTGGEEAGEVTRFGPWADEQLRMVLETFYQAASADLSDLEQLHAFRIAGKRLRYTMELLAGAYPRSFRKSLYRNISNLQEKLGSINDRRVAGARFLAWAEQCSDAANAQLLKDLAAAEADQLNTLRQQFFTWWTPEQSQALQSAFDKMLSLRNAEPS